MILDKLSPLKRSRCLVIVPIFGGGGAEKVLLTIMRFLNPKKIELILLILCNGNSGYLSDLPVDIKVYKLQYKRVRDAIPELILILLKIKPNVIFSSLGYVNLVLSIISIFYPFKAKFIARESSILSEVINTYNLRLFWLILFKIFYKRLDLIVCQSNSMMKDLHQNFGVPINKILVINNPVDTLLVNKKSNENIDIFFNKEELNLICLARLSHEKGLDILIEAVALLPNLPIRLRIVGCGPLEQELKLHAQKYNVHRQIDFLGFLENPYPLLKASDFFILSSRFEGFPNVILESMVCGTMVISMPSAGGLRDNLSGLPGVTFCNEISASSLACKINYTFYSCNEYSSDLTSFDPHSIAAMYEEIFQ